ncbi:MAG: hypothetical protein K0U74_02770 [Alphaproteobacteria bacterium]|nr:hypothetical protein [Alphaproteobacteria bacterium]
MRFIKVLSAAMIVALAVAGCATKPKLSPQELAKLKGGRTTVTAYFVCAPINYLTGGKIADYASRIYVDNKVVGSIKYCGHTRFSVASGQRQFSVENRGSMFNPKGYTSAMIFKPGKHQYLKIYHSDYNVFYDWVSKSEADQSIAAIKQVKPVF